MKYSKNALERITEPFEGFSLVAYQDSKGIWTIGYGHTKGVSRGMTCTRQQAEAWLVQDISLAEYAVNRLVKIQLNQNEFDALVDFVFNVGGHNLEVSTLLKRVNAGDIAGAAAEFPKWDHCGGIELAGLLRRRLAEEELFLKKDS
jgi:lysozyme